MAVVSESETSARDGGFVPAAMTLAPWAVAGRGHEVRGPNTDCAGHDPAPGVGVPSYMDTFIGRASLLEEIGRLLGSEHRLVTLTGPGGVGKTRAGMRAAAWAEASQRFAHGVAVAELADVPGDDHAQLYSRLLTAVGILDNSPDTPHTRLIEHLRGRDLLLVIDNCEHALSLLVPILRALLRAAPRLRVLATSRATLGLQGEHRVDVPPLNQVPADGRPSEAVRLLVARAAAAQVTVSPDDPDAARLCALVDGLPLAIELVVGRLRVRDLGAVVEAVRASLDQVGEDPHAEQSHHRTLRATMDWSYSLASEHERVMWAVLAEFHGDFCPRLAVDLCAQLGIAESDALDGLARLLDTSILTTISQPWGDTWFRMLDSLRRYGRHLDPTGIDRDRVRRAHAEYFAFLARYTATDWFGPEEVELLRALTGSISSITESINYFLDRPDESDRGLALAVDLARSRVHMYGSLLATSRRALAQARSRQPTGPPTPLMVTATALEAFAAFSQGDTGSGLSMLVDALGHAEALGGPTQSTMLFVTGVGMALSPDRDTWAQSVRVLDQAVDAATAEGERSDAARCRLFATIADGFHGDARAIDRARDVLADAEAAGAEWAVSWALWALALSEHQHGDIDQAARVLHRALLIHDDLGDFSGMTWTTWLAAMVAAGRGDHSAAATLIGAVRGLQRHVGVSVSGIGPFSRVEITARSAVLRALGENGYATRVEAGEALCRKDVVTLALSTLDTPDPTSTDAEVAEDQRLSGLTARESQVVALVARGYSNRQIAAELVVSERTVEWHVSNALAKVGAANRAGLAHWHLTCVADRR
ncbi:Transcriptional regulator [Alloactinosynnema sp. L-07]|uniref:ATP-binding protein n=1 Tax=Alloactinosynnema sp. L-07 TaxID=1653480 RepID=UPI00065EFC5A|nr:LuxR C-terminal-related transcriptional regulator [Alloactinosynnema sp. L-07]CRK57016.1 Transcriptional regulator [Alloactinosynnema sp. L-07]